MDPADVAGTEQAGGGFGEAAIDLNVRAPPVAVVLGRAQGVVEKRPDGPVAETVVVIVDLFGAEAHGAQVQPVVFEVVGAVLGYARPAHPAALGRAAAPGRWR